MSPFNAALSSASQTRSAPAGRLASVTQLLPTPNPIQRGNSSFKVELSQPVPGLEFSLYSASFELLQTQVLETPFAAGMHDINLDTHAWPLGITIVVAQITGQGRVGQCRRMTFVKA
jgi:hypothetical protein